MKAKRAAARSARRRHADLATGFDYRALRLAGVTEELDAAEDAVAEADEARIEGCVATDTITVILRCRVDPILTPGYIPHRI